MRPFSCQNAKTLCINFANIDTDQIIPARFLTVTSSVGLGNAAFADWRFFSNGEKNPDCVFNQPKAEGVQVLVTGENFGCGSSREHAAWALRDFGIRAVISSSIADIFSSNAVKNGMAPLEVTPQTHRQLLKLQPERVNIDLENRVIEIPDCSLFFSFEIDAFASYCLVHGLDQLDFILRHDRKITAFEEGGLCMRS